jgi:quercetin dioxygenase-like cupin family protein
MSYSIDGPREAMVSGRGEGRPVHVLGADLTIKISSRDTNGAFAVFEGHTPPLEGPPLHRHSKHDEWWYIVEGEYRFEIDGKEIYAVAGSTVYAPRGSRHTFQNVGSERGWTITTVIPGGVDLFFEDLDSASPRGAAPDPAKILPIFEKHGQELLGPPLRARSTGGISTAG